MKEPLEKLKDLEAFFLREAKDDSSREWQSEMKEALRRTKLRRKKFQAIKGASPKPKVVQLYRKSKPGQGVFICPSHHHPGKWQLTDYDEKGMIGHETFPTYDEALEEGLERARDLRVKAIRNGIV